MWTALSVKLKIEQKLFPELKIQNLDFWGLLLGCTFKFFPIYKEILGFFNAAPAGLLNCSNFTCSAEKLEFLKSAWFHTLLDSEDNLSGTVFLEKREGNSIYD